MTRVRLMPLVAAILCLLTPDSRVLGQDPDPAPKPMVQRIADLERQVTTLQQELRELRAQLQPTPVNDARFLHDLLRVEVFRYPEPTRTTAERRYVKRLIGQPGGMTSISEGVAFAVGEEMMSKASERVIERITVEGGKVEISGDTIKIEGGIVEITRRHRP